MKQVPVREFETHKQERLMLASGVSMMMVYLSSLLLDFRLSLSFSNANNDETKRGLSIRLDGNGIS